MTSHAWIASLQRVDELRAEAARARSLNRRQGPQHGLRWTRIRNGDRYGTRAARGSA